ncbi:pyridoxine 5'-phosphate synthase [Aureimonas ureilytica]|uniref:Pyridoxine 5'-phosphate synthase n=1 Tax=Aureimonas ureilytica TaxID=401562 RepID=A0A175RD04_9HYPH|nr:pyridoxine 5'-phosphate synthase [Aureimonas ureilytica]KTQ97815.1 pyridoxine 5'-phosphate synthase [Aureimonas ureilytica]
MTATLSVNLNAIAMLRNRRDLPWPDVIHFGRIALQNGASGLTVHPRPDQRHVRFSDVPALRDLIDREFPSAEFNIEGYPSDHFLQLCEDARADQVTLVPDDPTQATSDHGWDFAAEAERLVVIVARLKARGIRVSLFADPSPVGLDIARRVGADRVEFYTGPYGATHSDAVAAQRELAHLKDAGDTAAREGLEVNAGHDLTIDNLPALCRAIPALKEVSIGHAFTADALEHGFAETTRRFIRALQPA